MICPACHAAGPFEDGFCAHCGLEQERSRLPVKREASTLPAVWREAAPVVVRGLALVAAGVAAEWLLRTGTRKAVTAPFSARRRAGKAKAVAPREPQLLEEIVAVSRTVITRRIVPRR
jgi:hypothetical protein